MSLLEDIFLQDEADEAQELERVIEGDEYEERQPISEAEEDENVIGEDEAEEDKRRVDPTSTKAKRVIKNPRFILNPARLTGPRGIQVIPEHFKDFKFKGKGHEKEDVDLVLKKLEHWAYRLYPKFQFEDCLKKIETLGKKRPVMVHLHKIRTDQYLSEAVVTQKDSSDDEQHPEPEEDEFDKLLQQQIDLARATPAPGSVRKGMETLRVDHQNRSPFMMPKATSSPSISDEQKERMLRNRKLAEERRLAKLKENTSTDNTSIGLVQETTDDLVNIPKKHNRSNVIDSSDDECEVSVMNTAVDVDIHTSTNNIEPKTQENNSNSNEIEDLETINPENNDNITKIDDSQTTEDTVIKNNSGNDNSDHTVVDNAIKKINNDINIESDNQTNSNNELLKDNRENTVKLSVISENTDLNTNTDSNEAETGIKECNNENGDKNMIVDSISKSNDSTRDTDKELNADKDIDTRTVDVGKINTQSEVIEDLMEVDFNEEF